MGTTWVAITTYGSLIRSLDVILSQNYPFSSFSRNMLRSQKIKANGFSIRVPSQTVTNV